MVLDPSERLTGDTYTSRDRLRVSDTNLILYKTFQYTIEEQRWDTATVSGATVSHNADFSAVQYDVPATPGAKVTRQTKTVVEYNPGRASDIGFTFASPTKGQNYRRRIGLFDGEDGFYLEVVGDRVSAVIASTTTGSPVLTVVDRGDWNIDRFDGNGPSNVELDTTKFSLWSIDYEWYGAGNIVFSLIVNNEKFPGHSIATGNRLSTPWMRTPFLPLRFEVENLGNTTEAFTFYQGSISASLEGGERTFGVPESIASPIAGITLAAAQTFYPLISIRLRSDRLEGIVRPTSFEVATIDTAGTGSARTAVTLAYQLVLDADLNGTWQDVPSSGSFVEYNNNASGVLSGGRAVKYGYVQASSVPIDIVQAVDFQLARNDLGTSAQSLTLAVATVDNITSAVARGAVNWVELR